MTVRELSQALNKYGNPDADVRFFVGKVVMGKDNPGLHPLFDHISADREHNPPEYVTVSLWDYK